MADTPKGETASPADDAAPIRLGDASRAGEDSAPAAGGDDTIAAGTAGDSLAAGGARDDDSAGPWSPAPPSRGDRATDAARAEPAPRPSSARRLLIVAILVVLAVGGAYATYPMWRGELAPLASSLGISLPPIETAQAPTPELAPEPAARAPEPAAPTPQQSATPAPAPAAEDDTPAPPAEVADPALAGEVDRLDDRLSALEQRVAEIAERPAEAPPAGDGEAVAGLESRIDTRLEELTQRLSAVTDEMAIVREGLGASGGGEGLGPMAAQLSERLQGLATRIEALEQAPAAPQVDPDRLDALQGRVDSVAGSLDSEVRKSAEDVIRLETRLAGVEGRLGEIAKALESTRSGREKAGAFLLAANQLAAVAGTSAGFDAELEALRATAPADPEVTATLDGLDPHRGGVPSLAVLRERFGATASATVDAALVGNGEGVIGQALTRMASLVTIRRTATDEGDGLDAKLVRAEAALAGGDLTAAVAAMKQLDGAPAEAAAPWLADAEARLAVDGAVRALQAKALSGVAGG